MKVSVATILGIHISLQSKEILLEKVQKYLDTSDQNPQKSFIIFTPNTEQLVLAQKNSEFAHVLNQADIAIPDTGGVVWAGHMLKTNGPKQVIPGVEFMEDLSAIAANRHIPIGLIGGKGDIAVRTFECLRNTYPGLEMSAKPRIIFVALGAPKQEFYIVEQAKKTKGVVFMAVGGSFDIIGRRLPRAPGLIRRLRVPFFQGKIGFEWMWRLILEPWRVRRQLALVEFVWFVCHKKLASKGDALRS